MKERFIKAVIQSSDLQVLIVIGVLLIRRAWRIVPNLRPRHILLPSAFAQIAIFVYAALSPIEKFLPLFAVGNLVIIAIATLPMLVQPQKPSAHWVRLHPPQNSASSNLGEGREGA
jgi:hypothetical protein